MSGLRLRPLALLGLAFAGVALAGVGAACVGAAGAARAGDRAFTLASATTTDTSGLFDFLLPRFMAKTGIRIDVLSVGTGQAVRLGRNGDADVLLLNHRASEDALVAEGHGSARFEVMANDFVVVGPPDDPAGIRAAISGAEAFRMIGRVGGPFVSRGDDSGTHLKELALWRIAGVDGPAASGDWYRAAGLDMGATLNAAAALGAYTLTDRATWLAFRNRVGLAMLFEADEQAMVNQYTVIPVDPARHPHVRATEGRTFVVWLTSEEGQRAIAEFTIDGLPAYRPDAAPAGR